MGKLQLLSARLVARVLRCQLGGDQVAIPDRQGGTSEGCPVSSGNTARLAAFAHSIKDTPADLSPCNPPHRLAQRAARILPTYPHTSGVARLGNTFYKYAQGPVSHDHKLANFGEPLVKIKGTTLISNLVRERCWCVAGPKNGWFGRSRLHFGGKNRPNVSLSPTS